MSLGFVRSSFWWDFSMKEEVHVCLQKFPELNMSGNVCLGMHNILAICPFFIHLFVSVRIMCVYVCLCVKI